MTDYGVTSTGFVKKTYEVVKQDIDTSQLNSLGSDLGLLGTNVLGQLNGIVANTASELWDVGEAVYRSPYPDSASDEALDQVCSITGTIRLEATKSRVTMNRLLLDDGVSLAIGKEASSGSSGGRFATTAAVSNSTGYRDIFSATAESVEYGPIPGYAGRINTIQTPVSGWSASAALKGSNAGPFNLDGTGFTISVDGELDQLVSFSGGDPWSSAAVASEIESQILGVSSNETVDGYVLIASDTEGEGSSLQINAGGAITILGFPTDKIEGFNSEDAILGQYEEEDWALRVRREELLRVIGAGTVEAIRSRVRELNGVQQAFVFENKTSIDYTGTGGLPPHSFEVVVLGGDEDEIAQTIWLVGPAGIESYGSEFRTITDSQGFSHDVYFSRPTEVPIYIELWIDTNGGSFPIDGVAQVKAALKTYGDELTVGEDVIALQFKCVPLSVAGVIDVTNFKIDTVTPPVGTGNIPIGFRSLATFSTGSITVHLV